MHPLPRTRIAELWKPPKPGTWWKVNCDAAFRSRKVAVAMVIRDDLGLLVEAYTDIIGCSSAFEAEAKVVEWAVYYASSKEWKNLIFSFDAFVVVEEALSHRMPRDGAPVIYS